MFMDDKKVNIEGYENLIIMNIDSWGGGVNGLWKETPHFKK